MASSVSHKSPALTARPFLAAIAVAVALGTLVAAQSEGDLLNERISITHLVDNDGWDRTLQGPTALFFDDESGELFVADGGNHRIVIYDRLLTPKYSFLHFVPEFESGLPVLGEPRDLVVTADGEIIVVDNRANFLDVLDFRGTPVEQVALNRVLGDTSLTIKPQAIALGPENRLYVAVGGDLTAVVVLTEAFELERVIGAKQADLPPFKSIMGLTMFDDTLYVTDLYAEPAVKMYDLEGNFISGFAGHDVDRSDLSFPSGIAIMKDSTGKKSIWIADGLRQVVKVYHADGAFFAFVGGFGVKPGEFRHPSDIAISGDSLFFVLERAGGRISRFVIE